MVKEITGERPPAGEALIEPSRPSVVAQLRELWSRYRGRLLFGMALDFSEAAGYYGLFTFTATGVGACVAVGRVGAIIGNVVLGLSAAAFGLSSGFALLAGFWAIGALAAVIW